jgi:hypothetical protein
MAGKVAKEREEDVLIGDPLDISISSIAALNGCTCFVSYVLFFDGALRESLLSLQGRFLQSLTFLSMHLVCAIWHVSYYNSSLVL